MPVPGPSLLSISKWIRRESLALRVHPGSVTNSQTLLPITVALTRGLSSDTNPTFHAAVTLGMATIFSIHCALALYYPSIRTTTLGVCATIFLAKAFLFCESIEKSQDEQIELEMGKSTT